jgi:hypothetical protein
MGRGIQTPLSRKRDATVSWISAWLARLWKTSATVAVVPRLLVGHGSLEDGDRDQGGDDDQWECRPISVTERRERDQRQHRATDHDRV